MRTTQCLPLFAASSLAVELFLNEPDTGLETYLRGTNWTEGSQPLLKDIRSIPDFDFAARQFLDNQKYSFYRTAAAGEWSYRNNLEIWSKVHFRTRLLTDVTKVNETMTTTILGYKFSAPIFISPAARAAYGDPERAEINFMEAAAKEDILYSSALYASKTIEELAAVKSNKTMNGPQVTFQQIYTDNLSMAWDAIARAEKTGAKALIWTIDAPATPTRHRGARYDTNDVNAETSALSWDVYDQIRNRTSLPIIPKGITTVEDALLAIEKGVPAIYISNHGARQLDHSPSPLEIAYEIRRNAPEVFSRVEVLADSGVRYGSDVLKLLALGVRAVGMGRPFMYANCYGLAGVEKAIRIMKTEILADASQAGIYNVQRIPISLLNTKVLDETVFVMGSSEREYGQSLSGTGIR